MSGHLTVGVDGAKRCSWAVGDPLYEAYHDTEWGRPVVDDAGLFERISLEGFQAGLSWITILRKRDAFREVFAGFEPAVVATYGFDEVGRLLEDARIIRHRGKIEATIGNAGRALELIRDVGSLAGHLRGFAPRRGSAPRSMEDIPSVSEESRALSADLKRRGWSYVGPTTVYAAMQAVGLVNDHMAGCHVRAACEAEARAAWGGA